MLRKVKSVLYWGVVVALWVVFGGIAFLLFVAPYFGVAWEFFFPD